MSKSKRNRGRGPRVQRSTIHPQIHLTPEGVPAGGPDTPPVSPVVFVAEESLKLYPWLPARVIAGSIWRGPHHERVRVDVKGFAEPIALARRIEQAR